MPIKRLTKDPRTVSEKTADAAILAAHEAGTSLTVSAAREAAISEQLARNYRPQAAKRK